MRPAWRRPLPAAWRIALPEWRRPMVVWRTTLSIGQRWFPAWRWAGAQVPRRPWVAGRGRGALPLVGPLLVGMLGYLLLGAGPRSNVVRNTAPAPWALPAYAVLDLPAADAVWAQRAPWGAAANVATGAQAAPAPVLVGVVVERGRYEALFAIAGAPMLRVRAGDALPGGGRVTTITHNRVSWTDPAGQPRQRELLVEPREAPVPPAGG